MDKKMAAIVLLGLVFLTCVSGCVATDNPKEPLVFSILYNQSETKPFQEDWLILEEYKKRKNVMLDVRLGDDADYKKALRQTFEAGDIPDIVLKVWPENIEEYAASGLLLPFSDYEDRMPHFQAYIEEHDLADELDKLRLENGNYYLLPGYQREIQVQQWIYRRDLFEENGLGQPKTYDELFDALVTLKEIYPDTTPITATWGGAHLLAMMGAGYDIPAGWYGTRGYNEGEDIWQFTPATENYRALYRFLNRCYQAGILDPALFTQDETAFYAKLQDGRGLVTVTWITSGFSNWNEALQANGVPEGEWAPLPVPESTMGITALPPVDPFRKGLTVPSRVVNEPYFDDLLAFLDWAVYSEEGMTLTTWGVEGVTYETTSDGKVFLPEIKTPKNPDGTLDITADYGLATLFDLAENEEYEDYKKPTEIVKFLERSLEAGETAPMDPDLDLSANAIDALRVVNEKIDPYVAETGQHFITGELDIDQDWDDYLAELERRGYKTLEEIWNNAWEEQKN